MMEKMIALQQKRRSKKGGFTLVELIVVLVILAILAALLIPALTGYIDKAKEKNVIAETRQVVMAAQTLADESYGGSAASTVPSFTKDTANTIHFGAVTKLAEVKGTINSITVATTGKDKGKVTDVSYTSGGKTCIYNHDATTPYTFQ